MSRSVRHADRRHLVYGVGLAACAVVITGCLLLWHLHRAEVDDGRIAQARAGWTDGLRTTAPPSSSIAIVKHTDPQQIGNFAILRTSSEMLPSQVIQIMHGIHTYGMNWNLAQKMPAADGRGLELWLVPGNGYLCMLLRTDAKRLRASCATSRRALVHGLVAITLGASRRQSRLQHWRVIVGIAPDHVHHVLIPVSHGLKVVPLMDDHSFAWHDSGTAAPESVIFR